MASIEQTGIEELSGEALRAAVLEALAGIDSNLAAPAPGAREIHLARRAAKRARALSRLAPASVAELARQTGEIVSRARRMLGGARDADVRRNVLDGLKDKLAASHSVLQPLLAGDASQAPQLDLPATRAEIAALIRDWRLCDAGFSGDAILDAAAATYRKCRRRRQAASSGGNAELHRWRAAVVEHEYHAAFLARFRTTLADRAHQADLLRDYLGDINDLDALTAYAIRAAGEAERDAMRDLEHVAAARRAKLLVKAQALGERMFDARPDKWRRDLTKIFAP